MLNFISSSEFYDRFALEFDSYAKSKQNYLDAIDRLVIHNVPKGIRVLDIGSGTGKRILKISKSIQPSELVCFDNSPKMVEMLNASGLSANCVDISEDIKSFKQKQFDLVLCMWNVLGHVPRSKQAKAFKNISKLLTDGGKLIFDVNNRHNIKAYGLIRVLRNFFLGTFGLIKGDYPLQLNGNTTSVHIFSEREIRKLLYDVGFKINKIVYVNYASGEIEKSQWSGQLLVIAEKV